MQELVRFVGYVPDSTLVPLIAAARAVVHPSRAEGFGLTPLEAMAAGSPAIVATTAALPAAVGDAALVQDPDDVDAWVNAIDSLNDVELRARVAERGPRRGGRLHVVARGRAHDRRLPISARPPLNLG